MAVPNPDVSQRSNQTFYTGPIQADGTRLVQPIFVSDLPTADPAVAGQLWNDAGVVTVSAG
jgi:hypothetical protein